MHFMHQILQKQYCTSAQPKMFRNSNTTKFVVKFWNSECNKLVSHEKIYSKRFHFFLTKLLALQNSKFILHNIFMVIISSLWSFFVTAIKTKSVFSGKICPLSLKLSIESFFCFPTLFFSQKCSLISVYHWKGATDVRIHYIGGHVKIVEKIEWSYTWQLDYIRYWLRIIQDKIRGDF